MGIVLAPEGRWAALRDRTPTITTLCSHSSLQIFHGARVEGLPSLGIAVGAPAKFYDAFPLGRPDKFLSVPKVSALPKEAKRLRDESAVLVPHGSFVEYLGPEAFMELDVPVFGNRKVIGWESDREKERVWLESAGVSMPRRYETPADVDGPVIVKYYGAKGGKGFFLAKNREALEGFKPTGPHVIQEYVLGTRYYVHFFYSPLSDRGYRVGHGSLELLGMDRRDEANIDELYKLGAHEELLKAGIRPTFVVTGNVPVVLRESLLPAVFDVGARIVERSIELFGGMVGPFCVEGIMTENLDFKVFEISTRIVAGTNLFISGSSYSDLIQPGLSTGRRIAMEIKQAQREDRLGEILAQGHARPLGRSVGRHKPNKVGRRSGHVVGTPCPKCGLPLDNAARFCSRCGTPMAGPFAGISSGERHGRTAGAPRAINPGSVIVVIGGIMIAAGYFFQLYLLASSDALRVNYLLDAEISDGLLGAGILVAVAGWMIHQVYVFRRFRAIG